MKIRIATRHSPLALLQTNEVIEKIRSINQKYECEIIRIKSDGDITDEPLHKVGGKGLFVSKLEKALSNGVADIAVHSLKDVPALIDSKFRISATLPRQAVGDALLLKEGLKISDLSKNLKIATSGPRRKAQLLAINSSLNIVPIRGNVQTRIDKMKIDGLDGLVVAKAAINRLNISHSNICLLSEDQMLPAAAQGAIGVEINKKNIKSEIVSLLELVNDKFTHQATEIERTVVASLDGNCLSPISALCKIDAHDAELKVRVSNQDGSKIYNQKEVFKLENKINALKDFIERLISNGAKEIIRN